MRFDLQLKWLLGVWAGRRSLLAAAMLLGGVFLFAAIAIWGPPSSARSSDQQEGLVLRAQDACSAIAMGDAEEGKHEAEASLGRWLLREGDARLRAERFRRAMEAWQLISFIAGPACAERLAHDLSRAVHSKLSLVRVFQEDAHGAGDEGAVRRWVEVEARLKAIDEVVP